MKKSIGDIFLKPERLYMALHNTNSEYVEDNSLDFYDQIYPRLLRHVLDQKIYENNHTFLYTGYPAPKTTEEIFIAELYVVIFHIFEPALRKEHFYKFYKKYYNTEGLENTKGIVGELTKLSKNFDSDLILFYVRSLITFFIDHPPENFKLREAIPAEWADEMTSFLHNVFHRNCRFINSAELEKSIDEYRFIPSEYALKKLPPMPNNIKLFPSEGNQMHLVVKNLKLEEANRAFCANTFSSQVAVLLLNSVIYEHCSIEHDIRFTKIDMGERIWFKDCVFYGLSAEETIFNRMIKFENCKFMKSVVLYKAIFKTALYLADCTFYKDGELKIENCIFEKFHPGHFNIQNCVFHCNASLKGTNIGGDFTLENSAFFENFDFTNLTFNSESVTISNIAFNEGIDIRKSKKILAETLDKNNQPRIIKKLGLSEDDANKTKFDYDAYQVAYNSGFLNPEYAAYFLGKSKVYLQKKRTQDKQKITRDSLPFKVDGKDIQYPVEALLAFKAKDWDTLKNLRKKYPIPTK